MGDHRASIHIDLEFPDGVKHSGDFWLNYWPDDDAIDPRIKEFCRGAWERWQDTYHELIWEAQQREQERLERAQLEALKAKYEKGTPPAEKRES